MCRRYATPVPLAATGGRATFPLGVDPLLLGRVVPDTGLAGHRLQQLLPEGIAIDGA